MEGILQAFLIGHLIIHTYNYICDIQFYQGYSGAGTIPAAPG
jgi:hypothetical protein